MEPSRCWLVGSFIVFNCTGDFLFPKLTRTRGSHDSLIISCPLLAIVDESGVRCTVGGTDKREKFYRTKILLMGCVGNWKKVHRTLWEWRAEMTVLRGLLLLVMIKAKIETRKTPGYLRWVLNLKSYSVTNIRRGWAKIWRFPWYSQNLDYKSWCLGVFIVSD